MTAHKTTRRAVLIGGATATLPCAAIAAVPLPDALNHPAANLIALAGEAIEVGRQYHEADKRADQLLELFYDRQPERPLELKARPTDGGIKHIGFQRDRRSVPEHRNKCWVAIDDVEALRTAQQTRGQVRWEFVGSDVEWGEHTDRNDRWEPDGEGGYQPPRNQRHLWEKRFDPAHHARADEILHAHDRYAADIERLRSEIGLDVAEARAEELREQLRYLESLIEKMPAVTIGGLPAKAEVIGRNGRHDFQES
ncbi:MAG: hypothetical protein WA851_12550 [Xanthobacteraceae bacterium]